MTLSKPNGIALVIGAGTRAITRFVTTVRP